MTCLEVSHSAPAQVRRNSATASKTLAWMRRAFAAGADRSPPPVFDQRAIDVFAVSRERPVWDVPQSWRK